MSSSILLITPPFTQLNTPYPATAYLKGFLKTKQIDASQADLGIEVILRLFSKKGLSQVFGLARSFAPLSENAQRILSLESTYILTIDEVIAFLQGKKDTLAHRLCHNDFLPRASRFDQLDDMQWAFGSIGLMDKAKHLSTLYLEDLSDLIQECVDKHFGFSRYAEQLGRSANSFDELYDHLLSEHSLVDRITLELLSEKVERIQPNLIAFSVPFPGNLFSAFRCAQWIKKYHPEIKTAMGGGFPNTELRSVSDVRVFEFFDFITLDDGEAPIEHLLEYLDGKREIQLLKRTFVLQNGQVEYINHSLQRDYRHTETGTPDYSDLLLDRYLSVIEIVNPMHRLWNDGRWNKLTMAHGCYWGKCTFCDISLDYIKNYEPATASHLCDQMETMIAQTGENGFHFVDEAAPPTLMKNLALEIIRRNLVVSWWTNIRFEKTFSRDLCFLLKASGCIGVSGGLEVASDRLLELIQKGVSVAQVAAVMDHFTQAGIMVHAYLMYGFPTQSAQETMDSLDMVRQLFKQGILKSAYWHRFAMTAHSPVGMHPDEYRVIKKGVSEIRFANNDIAFEDPTGADHEVFSFGLKKSLLNYMHGIGLDEPLQTWFDAKVPRPSVESDYIATIRSSAGIKNNQPQDKVIWLGHPPTIEFLMKSKKGKQWEMAKLSFHTTVKRFEIQLSQLEGKWLIELFSHLHEKGNMTFGEVQESYHEAGLEDFDLFWYNKPMNGLYAAGLLVV